VFNALDEISYFKSGQTDVGHLIGCIYRKSILGETRFVNVTMFEDSLFNMEIICKNPKIYVSSKYFYNYVRRENSITGKGLRGKEDVEILRKTVKDICDKHAYLPSETKMNFLTHIENIINKYSK
jgi:hypothetical protein